MSNRNSKVMVLAGAGVLALAAVVGIAHGAAHAGGPHHGFGGGRFFEKVDTNNDGILSKAEISAFVNSRVKEFDANNDGQITKAEFDAARKAKQEQRQQAMFKHIDSNGDGVISADELQNARAARWSNHHGHRGGPEQPMNDG